MISNDSWLTSLGESAWNSGLKPLNSAVRSSAGLVRSSGICAPSGASALSVAPVPSER